MLPFARSADFPEDKGAGTPCRNLLADHRCAIHSELRRRGWTGCTVFECFGAGQRVTQETFEGRSWRADTAVLDVMGRVFPVVHQLHEMLWLLADPAVDTTKHADAAAGLSREIDAAAAGDPQAVAAVDVVALRTRTGLVLRAVSDEVRGRREASGQAARRLPRSARPGGDLAGARLARADLRGAPLRGALAIAADLRGCDLRGADLLGTDLRDADIRDADLRESLFLTQPQVNGAHGDAETRLPGRLAVPAHWR